MKTKPILLGIALPILLFSLAAACSSGGSDTAAAVTGPSVLSNVPIDQATGVPVNAAISATFSESMAPDTLTTQTFTLTSDDASNSVPGRVIYRNLTAVFWPTARLAINSNYVATITTGALNLDGVGLKSDHSWRFTTGDTVELVRAVDLGTAGNFAVLAKAAISTVPGSAVTGDLGISPAAATFVTGFALTLDASNQFSTSSQVSGRVFAADYSPPTPANLTTAVRDMEIAFLDAEARAPDVTELGAGDIGGMTLAQGVYRWGAGLRIPTDVTLAGSATDVWIFQIARDLTVSSATSVILTGGAQPENVFWQVSGRVDLGTTSSVPGNILTATAIAMRTGASVNGRLLAQTAVNVDASTITEPVQ